MKKIVTKIILSAVVAAMAALLLAGCREGSGPSTKLMEQPSTEFREQEENPQVSIGHPKKIVIDTVRSPRNDAMGVPLDR